jgi:hypothetical protein
MAERSFDPRDRRVTAAASANGRQRVYAVGQVGYDFGTEANRRSFETIGVARPYDPNEMLGFLRQIYPPLAHRIEPWFNEFCPDHLRVRVSVHPQFGVILERRSVVRPQEEWQGEQPIRVIKRGDSPPVDDEPNLKAAEAIPPFGQTRDLGAQRPVGSAPPYGLFSGVHVDQPAQPSEEAFYYSKGRRHLLSGLMHNATYAERLIWTLVQNERPLYAICPSGPFAMDGYHVLIQFLLEQQFLGTPWVSLPGHLDGTITLQGGHEVPVLVPEISGMYNWNVVALNASVTMNEVRRASQDLPAPISQPLNNPGLAACDRAYNFAATTAFQLGEITQISASGQHLESLELTQQDGSGDEF